MIGKRGKLLVLLYAALLAVLFLMCSTELIIREPEKEIYQIAVIIEDAKDDNYSSFRKGMDQAAMEYNADVRFITLYEKMDAAQQMELLGREQQDGADALIVAPVDEDRVKEALDGKQVTVPVVLLGTEQAEEEVKRAVITDYRKMGAHLAEQMQKRLPEGCPVLIFSDQENRSAMSRYFLEGAEAVLLDGGHKCSIAVREKELGYRGALEELRASGQGGAVLAESPEILAETAGLLADDPPYAGYVQGLYGRGSTLPILNDLDRGLISGVCVTDEFSAGYYSVFMAVQALEDSGRQMPVVMDSYYIEKQDLRKPEYEKMLFPIE